MNEIEREASRLVANEVAVKVKRLHPDAVLPQYAREGDAGFDLTAVEDTIVAPGKTALVKTGLAFELPPGYELQVRPRSGVSLRTKLRVANAPGTVDSGFVGEVCVIVDNIAPEEYRQCTHTGGPISYNEPEALSIDGSLYRVEDRLRQPSYIIRKGDRIAQGVLQRVPTAVFAEVDELGDTQRGEGGFGSTGVGAE